PTGEGQPRPRGEGPPRLPPEARGTRLGDTSEPGCPSCPFLAPLLSDGRLACTRNEVSFVCCFCFSRSNRRDREGQRGRRAGKPRPTGLAVCPSLLSSSQHREGRQYAGFSSG